MFWKTEIESLAHQLENHVFFCLENIPPQIQKRQKDMKDVVVVSLLPFKGEFSNKKDVDKFDKENELLWREDDARAEKKICVLVAPNLRTAQIAYVLMRDWCPTSAVHTKLPFDHMNLVPLIEKPRH